MYLMCTSTPAWHLGCICCVSLIPPGTSVSAEEHRGRALLLSVLLLCPVSYDPSSGAKEARLPENVSVPWEVNLSHSERLKEQRGIPNPDGFSAAGTIHLCFSLGPALPHLRQIQRFCISGDENQQRGRIFPRISYFSATCLHVGNVWCTNVTFTAAVLPPAKSKNLLVWIWL